jgi:hypothetical protein
MKAMKQIVVAASLVVISAMAPVLEAQQGVEKAAPGTLVAPAEALVVSCLVVAYLSANILAIVKMRVFELAHSRKHLHTLWRPLHIVGLCHPDGMQAHGDHEPI